MKRGAFSSRCGHPTMAGWSFWMPPEDTSALRTQNYKSYHHVALSSTTQEFHCDRDRLTCFFSHWLTVTEPINQVHLYSAVSAATIGGGNVAATLCGRSMCARLSAHTHESLLQRRLELSVDWSLNEGFASLKLLASTPTCHSVRFIRLTQIHQTFLFAFHAINSHSNNLFSKPIQLESLQFHQFNRFPNDTQCVLHLLFRVCSAC